MGKDVLCPRCAGDGFGKNWVFCSLCGGSGNIMQEVAGAYRLIAAEKRPQRDEVRKLLLEVFAKRKVK